MIQKKTTINKLTIKKNHTLTYLDYQNDLILT